MNDEAMIDYAKYARIFKVMSDPKRLKIIDMLSSSFLYYNYNLKVPHKLLVS